MPRRNERGAGRRGSLRSSGGSAPRKEKSSAKPYKAPRKEGPKDSAPRRYSAGKRNFSKGSFREERPKGTFSASSKTSRSQRGSDRGFKAHRKSDASIEPDKKPLGRSVKDAKSESGNKRKFAGPEKTRERTRSFGKPYKKSYRTKPPREGLSGFLPERRPRRKVAAETSPDSPKSDKIRLNKFIANSGISSRREADELITMGLISVNGKVVTELGYKINAGDEVRYEDKVLRAERPVYILMNKPKGFLTTTEDPQDRKTVMHIVGSAVKERIYPVGRLDRNTTGLLLLTNDGDLADKLMHPSFDVRKVYKAELDKPLTKADFQAIIEGVRLEEGRATVDELAIISDDSRTVGIELHIGWNRVVRRIFESLGYEVLKLDRTAYAGLDKKELSRGQWRFLAKEEIIRLKHFK